MSDEDKKTNTAKLCLSIKTVTSNTKKKKNHIKRDASRCVSYLLKGVCGNGI